MKNLLWIFVAVFGLAFATPAMAEAPKVPADGLKMEKTKKPVVFNHSTHTSVSCATCHHPVDGKEDYRKCSTAGCHDSMDRKVKGSYYKVMHDKKGTKYDTCLSCHVKIVKEKGLKGDDAKKLVSCGKGSGCHVSK